MSVTNVLSQLDSGRLETSEFAIAVALGLVGGWRSFRKFGMNPGVPASGMEEMWPRSDLRVLPAVAAVAYTTAGAADVADTGTGAWTVQLEGLDADYNEIEEIISLTGATPALSTQEFLRINRAFVVTAGTGTVNAGNIDTTVGGNVQTHIELMEGQTHQTHYTVPAGHSVIVTAFTVGVGRMSGTADVHIASSIKPVTANSSWRAISDVYLYQNIHTSENSMTVIPEKTEVKQVIASNATTQAFSTWSGYLVRNSALAAVKTTY